MSSTASLPRCWHVLAIATCLTSFGVSSRSFAQQGLDPATRELLDRQIEIANELKELAQAEAGGQRQRTIQAAIALSQKEKQAAKTERDRIEIQRLRLQHMNQMRQWALGSYLQTSGARLVSPQHVTKNLQRSQKVQEQWKNIFVSSPEQSWPSIKNAKALNFFLDLVGNVAIHHQMQRKKLESDRELLAKEMQPLENERKELTARARQLKDSLASGTLPDDVARKGKDELVEADLRLAGLELVLAEADQHLKDMDERRAILKSLAGQEFLTDHHRQNIRFQRGEGGAAMPIHSVEGALPLDWPYYLLTDDDFMHLRSRLEQLKQAALDDLGDGHRIEPHRQREMFETGDEMQRLMRRKFSAAVKAHVGGWPLNSLFEAIRFIEALRPGIIRFNSAASLADIQPTAPLEAGSIDEILVYMGREGLRFAPARFNEETTYRKLYDELVNYYVALHVLELTLQNDEGKERELRTRDERLFRLQHRSIVDDTKLLLEARPSESFLEQVATVVGTTKDFAVLIDKIRNRRGGR